jgi:hypothetical protein
VSWLRRRRPPAPRIDSKVVDRSLREILWPELKAIGFRRTGRTAWRDRPSAIQVVCIQSFNSYLADGLGATTFSFSVPLGVFYPIVAAAGLSHFRGDPRRPAEWDCHARYHLGKGISQAGEWLRDWPPDRRDIWFVRPDGTNLDEVVRDAHDRIFGEGIAWLERLADLREARRAFAEDEDAPFEFGVGGEFYGGTIGSPARSDVIEALSTANNHPSQVGD